MPTAETVLNLETFQMISRAVARHEQLRLQYRKPGNKQIELRIVNPYHLANVNGEWFLFAWCHLRKDIRTFVPARIKGVELTGESFKRPANFSIQNLLKNSFGIHWSRSARSSDSFQRTGSRLHSREKWHPSQELRELPDGGIELKLKLSSLVEINRWLLGWGANAKVLEPLDLISSLRKSAELVLEHYGTN